MLCWLSGALGGQRSHCAAFALQEQVIEVVEVALQTESYETREPYRENH